MNTTQDPTPLFDDESPATVPDAGDSLARISGPNAPAPRVDSSADDAHSMPQSVPDEQPEGVGAPTNVPIDVQPSCPDVAIPAASMPTAMIGSVADVDAWLAGTEATVQVPQGGWHPTDAQADAAMDAWIAADPNAPARVEGPLVVRPGGKVERTRTTRQPLVPKWMPWVVAGVLLVAGIVGGVAALLAARARVVVPTVSGLTTQVARDRVGSVGLKLTVTDRRFSTLPVDTILSQTPEAGATTTRGSAVTVVVSGGTEEFNMPDVVGQGLVLARSQLDQKGLQIQVVAQPSDQPSDTVLATNPVAGSPMHTGDAVTITVAQNTTGTPSTTPSTTLVPFTLNGVKITVDPAAAVSGQPDVAAEVARRLQSLLEASGAKVFATRSSADTGTAVSATARQARARENTPTVAVGLDVISSGSTGMIVSYPSSAVSTAAAAPSLQLAGQITSNLAGTGLAATQKSSGSDPVLAGTTAPYSRVVLGTTASSEDLSNFKDPSWADKVARALYQAIGSLYGVRNTTP